MVKQLLLAVPLVAAVVFVFYSFNLKTNIEYPLCGGGFTTLQAQSGSGVAGGPCLAEGEKYSKNYKFIYASIAILIIVVAGDGIVISKTQKSINPQNNKKS